jgi:hypothetical protein
MALEKIGKIPTPVRRIQDALKVQAKDYNDLVDAFNAVVPVAGTAKANTIEEYTTGSGVEVDGVLLKDGTTSMLTQTLIATGTNQATGSAVVGQLVFVTGADATTGVVLPAVSNGKVIFLINTANAVLKIYPASGEKIQGGVADANISLAAYGVCIFGYKAAGDWYTTEITAGAVA